jgi:hypothetical protein
MANAVPKKLMIIAPQNPIPFPFLVVVERMMPLYLAKPLRLARLAYRLRSNAESASTRFRS